MRLSSYLVAATAFLVGSAYAGLEDVKSTTTLTNKNFDSAIAGKNSLVAFYAPWCSHCKNLAGTWERLGNTFADEESILIGQLDADNAENKPAAARFGVKGFPTIKFFPADGSAPLDYNGPRSEEAFIEYINKAAGTNRLPGGLLNSMAGRLPTLDQIVSSYLTTTTGARDAIVAQAKALAAEVQGGKLDKTAASYYVKVMEKLENSSDWAVKELARLQKMTSKKGSMAGKQLEDLQIRQNILQAFTAAKGAASSVASEASASIGSAASQASASAGSAASKVSASAGSAASQASSAAAQATASAGSAAAQVSASAGSAASQASASIESAASAASASASSVSKSASSLAESATARVKAEL
ncbi:thioredoxin-domain-containing protein [Cystobasidium minutum MCA 4210]|uniref:thioredoxin-domain-containing protein n=1 Tax=Cystobasidium minutum MCA 4210 TaxID=1397322 RepID=UPI0034CDAB3F|eukprot:jgi/Rhomi1/147181/e_gw1.8.208.1